MKLCTKTAQINNRIINVFINVLNMLNKLINAYLLLRYRYRMKKKCEIAPSLAQTLYPAGVCVTRWSWVRGELGQVARQNDLNYM